MTTRTYASGSFRLTLDNETATLGGFTETAGTMNTLWTGMTVSVLNKVLASAINFGRAPSSARIISVAYNGKVIQVREVSSVRFMKFVFEEVGATLNVPGALDVLVSGTSKYLPGDGSAVSLANAAMAQQQWLRCHYRLELGNLPTQRVTAIGAINIAAPNSAQDFLISVQQIDAQAYRQALKAGAPMKAVVRYLTPSMATLCSLTFPNARLAKEVPTKGGLVPAQFQVSPGRAEFKYGG